MRLNASITSAHPHSARSVADSPPQPPGPRWPPLSWRAHAVSNHRPPPRAAPSTESRGPGTAPSDPGPQWPLPPRYLGLGPSAAPPPPLDLGLSAAPVSDPSNPVPRLPTSSEPGLPRRPLPGCPGPQAPRGPRPRPRAVRTDRLAPLRAPPTPPLRLRAGGAEAEGRGSRGGPAELLWRRRLQ